MGKFSEIDMLARDDGRPQPHHQAKPILDALEAGNPSPFFDYIKSGQDLDIFRPEDWEKIERVLEGKSFNTPGRRMSEITGDAWIRYRVALHNSKGKSLSRTSHNQTAFEAVEKELLSQGVSIGAHQVRKIWGKGKRKSELKSAVATPTIRHQD